MWNRYCIVFGTDKGAIQMELNEFQENLHTTEKFSQVPSKLHHNKCLKTLLFVFVFVSVFVVRSLDLYKAKSPLDIELVNG